MFHDGGDVIMARERQENVESPNLTEDNRGLKLGAQGITGTTILISPHTGSKLLASLIAEDGNCQTNETWELGGS